jgi:HlyD family secretion protein
MHMPPRSSDLPWLEALREARGHTRPVGGLHAVPLSAMDRSVEQHWLTRQRVGSAAAALLVLVGLAFAYVRYGAARTLTLSSDRVVLSPVKSGDFLEYIPVSGNVEPRETVYLDAVDGGQVAQLEVEEGAFVRAGQPLVRLDNAGLRLQVLNSEAQLSEQLDRLASAKLQFAQSRLAHEHELIDAKYQADAAAKQLARLSALAGSGVVRRADLEDAQLQYDRTQPQSRLATRTNRCNAIRSPSSIAWSRECVRISRSQSRTSTISSFAHPSTGS